MRSEPVRADAAAFDAIAPGDDAGYATPVGRLVDRLGVARAKSAQAKRDIARVQADARVLPFRSSAFELVTLKPGRALGEAHRVLKSGGNLVVAILNRSGLWTLWRRLERRFVRSIWREAKFLGADELRELLQAWGFATPRWQRAVHFLPLFARGRAGWLDWWEAIGARWTPACATFVAAAARRF